MNHIPLRFSDSSWHSRINVDRLLSLGLPFCLCFFRSLLTIVLDTFYAVALSTCFIPASFVPLIRHCTPSVLIVLGLLIHQTRLRLLNDSKTREIYSCISTHGQYCVISFPFVASYTLNESKLPMYGGQNTNVHY